MPGIRLDIHRKLALLLAVAFLLVAFLAVSLSHFLGGAWRFERAARSLLELRKQVFYTSAYVEDLVGARQRGESGLDNEASNLLRGVVERIESELAHLLGGGGPDHLPAPFNDEARAAMLLVAERWEHQHEALRLVLEGRQVMGNRAVVRVQARDLVNQLDSAHHLYVKESGRRWSRARLCLAVFVLGFVVDMGYGVWLLGFGFFRRYRRLGERMKELSAVDLQLDTLPATKGADLDELGELGFQINRFVERARAADRTKDRFLATMSHEIRTPLNGVIGFLENLRETPLNEQQRQYLRLIDSSARSLLKVINGILDFSKISSGSMELESVAFDLGCLLEERQAMTRQLVRGKRVKVSLALPEDRPLIVRGDPGRLRQVLDNLLGNAAKFTEKGEIAICLEAHPAEAETLHLAFAIRDTGIGIQPERLKTLFTAFTQAEPGTARKYGGTGLGLCISSGLVALMGGKLEVRSVWGEGTRFEFSLCLPVAAPEEQVRISEQFDIVIPPGALRQFWALLVDDTPTNLFLMETVCQSIGLPYRTARNGQEAVDKCRQQHFDLVFMDIQMPVMDGYTAIREIRKLEDAQTTQIIALTASAFKEDVNRALGAGSTGFIAKPFERNHLLLTIAEYLGIEVERRLREMPELQEDASDGMVRGVYDFMQGRYQASLGEIKLVLAQTVVDWRVQLDDLRVFAKKGNWDNVRAIMHRLKGQLSSIGLGEFADFAAEAGDLLRQGATEGLFERIEDFIAALQVVFRKLEAEVTIAEHRPETPPSP